MTALTYKKAGVDIDEADNFIRKIKPLLAKASRPEVLGSLGGFSGLFKLEPGKKKDPVLVASTDGVGTKLLLAEEVGRFDTIGIDLVAMCADDVVVTGAEPLFFLDYIACGRLDSGKLRDVMKGIVQGCREAGCALIGGETAELPGMYTAGRFDLAGFCVGWVSRSALVDGSRCQAGDKVIGLASSGLHSNGYSLVRKIFTQKDIEGPLGKELLTPTRIYTLPVLSALKRHRIKALAHITGGGLTDNLPRVLPPGLYAEIKKESWPVPSVFKKIREKGRVVDGEMYRTFNMGVGMAAVTGLRIAQNVIRFFREHGVEAWPIGELKKGKKGVRYVS